MRRMRIKLLSGSLLAVGLLSAEVTGYAACDYSETATITVGPQSVVCLGQQVTFTASKACDDPDLVIESIAWSGFPGAANCNGSMSCSVTPSSVGCVIPAVQIIGHNGTIGYCADSDGTVTNTVVSVTRADSSIWWFKGEDAANYHESTTLTANKGTCSGSISWLITAGADKVVIVDQGANPATVNPLGTLVSGLANDITIACNYNGAPACSVSLTVRTPFSLEDLGAPWSPDDHPDGDGYRTYVRYRILDQLAVQLPNRIEINEKWLTAPISSEQYPQENWPQPLQVGSMWDPDEIIDRIGATAAWLSPSAVNPTPHTTAVDESVQTWEGVVSAGHDGSGFDGPGRGVEVRFIKWHMYRGKGRHDPFFP